MLCKRCTNFQKISYKCFTNAKVFQFTFFEFIDHFQMNLMNSRKHSCKCSRNGYKTSYFRQGETDLPYTNASLFATYLRNSMSIQGKCTVYL